MSLVSIIGILLLLIGYQNVLMDYFIVQFNIKSPLHLSVVIRGVGSFERWFPTIRLLSTFILGTPLFWFRVKGLASNKFTHGVLSFSVPAQPLIRNAKVGRQKGLDFVILSHFNFIFLVR